MLSSALKVRRKVWVSSWGSGTGAAGRRLPRSRSTRSLWFKLGSGRRSPQLATLPAWSLREPLGFQLDEGPLKTRRLRASNVLDNPRPHLPLGPLRGRGMLGGALYARLRAEVCARARRRVWVCGSEDPPGQQVWAPGEEPLPHPQPGFACSCPLVGAGCAAHPFVFEDFSNPISSAGRGRVERTLSGGCGGFHLAGGGWESS